jgi:hypothetical protein
VVPLGSIDDGPEQFSEGLANVKIGKKWGFVDKSGNLVVAARFDYAFKVSPLLETVEKTDLLTPRENLSLSLSCEYGFFRGTLCRQFEKQMRICE